MIHPSKYILLLDCLEKQAVAWSQPKWGRGRNPNTNRRSVSAPGGPLLGDKSLAYRPTNGGKTTYKNFFERVKENVKPAFENQTEESMWHYMNALPQPARLARSTQQQSTQVPGQDPIRTVQEMQPGISDRVLAYMRGYFLDHEKSDAR
jgi:hypothetical protein